MKSVILLWQTYDDVPENDAKAEGKGDKVPGRIDTAYHSMTFLGFQIVRGD